jgi:hypothetical protein
MDVSIPCVCPGDEVRHPEGDTVTLKDKLGFEEATACKQAIQLVEDDGSEVNDLTARRLAAVVTQYMFSGIASWTLQNGAAIPVTAGNIRKYLMSDFVAADLVSSEAETLYNPQVLIPLVNRAATSSRPTPTDELTSVTTGSTQSNRRRSSRSSTTTTRTGDTGMTFSPPDGDSNTSQS